MNELTKEQIKSLIISSVLVCLGILFIVLKAGMLGVIETIVCFSLLGFGVLEIMVYCFLNTENRDYSKLIIGAVSTVLALLLIFVGVLFVIILGVIVAISGLIYIKSAMQDKKSGNKNWWGSLIIGIIVFALGLSVAILYNLESLKNLIMILFGITLIFEGASGFVFTFVLHKELKLFVKKTKANANSENQETIEPEYAILNNNQEKMKKENNKNIMKKIKNINDDYEIYDDSGDDGFV